MNTVLINSLDCIVVLNLYLPAPIIFCSPHSGRTYPQEFLAASQLDAQTLRKSEDCYVDELFEAAPHFGVVRHPHRIHEKRLG